MTEPVDGMDPDQEASTGSAGNPPVEPVETTVERGKTPVEPVETPVEPVETPVEPVKTTTEPSLEQQLAERTADLQRLQAEYVNYKRRVDRDRELVRTQGETAVLLSLLTVLDDIGRAAEHGELEGGFKAVADALQQVAGKHKLESFGARGEPFDPSMHEAVFHAGESADVDTTTVDSVLRIGYKHGDRVLRAATVGVVDPSAASPASDDSNNPGEAEPAAEPSEASSDG